MRSVSFEARTLKFWHKPPLIYRLIVLISQKDPRRLIFLPPKALSQGFTVSCPTSKIEQF